MYRLTGLVFALAIAVVSASSFHSTAAARCAVVTLPEEVQRSPFVVEAVLESAGDTARFRTVTVWKGGDAAPARFSLAAQRGRGRWAWSDAANEGQRYVLFLTQTPSGVSVARCGQSGEATDARRSQLRAEGLTPTSR